jgi:hypothetical protein
MSNAQRRISAVRDCRYSPDAKDSGHYSFRFGPVKRLNRSTAKQSNGHMKIKLPLSLLAAASLALSSAAFAAGAKTYEATGPVLEVNDSMIAIQKGKDRWEINRDANTKVTGDVKVGDKVHITYTMSATEIEVKAGKGAKKEGASPAGSPKK